MAQKKPVPNPPTPDKPPPADRVQDRPSNVRLPEGVTPDQALSAVLRIKPEDAKRIREQEKAMKGGKKGKA